MLQYFIVNLSKLPLDITSLFSISNHNYGVEMLTRKVSRKVLYQSWIRKVGKDAQTRGMTTAFNNEGMFIQELGRALQGADSADVSPS